MAEDVIEFRMPYQKFYCCLEHSLPVQVSPVCVMLFRPANETVKVNFLTLD